MRIGNVHVYVGVLPKHIELSCLGVGHRPFHCSISVLLSSKKRTKSRAKGFYKKIILHRDGTCRKCGSKAWKKTRENTCTTMLQINGEKRLPMSVAYMINFL